MQALNSTVGELVTLASGLIALYFFVSMVINLAQAQVSTTTGDPGGHARALQQGITSVILLSVAASFQTLVPALQGYLSLESVPQTARDAISVWYALAELVTAVVLAGTIMLTAVAVGFAGLGAQMSHMLGAPTVFARSISRLAILFAGGILALSAVWLSHLLISILF